MGDPQDRHTVIGQIAGQSFQGQRGLVIERSRGFVGDQDLGVLEMVRRCQIAPLRSVSPEAPEVLENVVMKALAPAPEERYQNAAEMQRDIERILLERQPPGASDLARYLEVLYDSAERGEVAASEVGRGSTFTILLDEGPAPADPAGEATHGASARR